MIQWNILFCCFQNIYFLICFYKIDYQNVKGPRGCDRMVVGITTTYAICLSPLMMWVWIPIRARCATLCDKVCQWLATGQWFSLGSSVSSNNKTDHHDITDIVLKVALSTHKTNQYSKCDTRAYEYTLAEWNHWCVNS